jgi:predicted nucleotidyltransferase
MLAGKGGADSDLDLLVDYGMDVTLFDHFDLKAELEGLAHMPVDVVSHAALSFHRRLYVERDTVEIL